MNLEDELEDVLCEINYFDMDLLDSVKEKARFDFLLGLCRKISAELNALGRLEDFIMHSQIVGIESNDSEFDSSKFDSNVNERLLRRLQ